MELRFVKTIIVETGATQRPLCFELVVESDYLPSKGDRVQLGGWLGDVGPIDKIIFNPFKNRHDLFLTVERFQDTVELNSGELSANLETIGWTGVDCAN